MKRLWVIILVAVGFISPSLKAQDDTIIRAALLDVFEGIFAEKAIQQQACVEEFLLWAEAARAAGYTEAAMDFCTAAFTALYQQDRLARVEWYLKCYETFPEHAKTPNAAAWMLLLQRGDAEGALEILRGRENRSSEEMDTLAWAQFKAGHKVDAMQTIFMALRKAREEDSAQWMVFDHAGDILYVNGHYREAYLCWERGARLARAVINEGLGTEEVLFGFECYTIAFARKKCAAVRRMHPEAFAEEKQEERNMLYR